MERVTANEVADERVIGFLLEQSARFDMCVGLCSVANPEHPSAFCCPWTGWWPNRLWFRCGFELSVTREAPPKRLTGGITFGISHLAVI